MSRPGGHRCPARRSPTFSLVSHLRWVEYDDSSLVSHLRWVEYYWIRVVLLGEEDRTPVTEQDPDAEMRLGLDVPIARLLAEYRASCDQLRELVAPLDLDTQSQGTLSWRREPVTLRWVLMHLIEETARHNGHIDILREMADGLTGR